MNILCVDKYCWKGFDKVVEHVFFQCMTSDKELCVPIIIVAMTVHQSNRGGALATHTVYLMDYAQDFAMLCCVLFT